MQHIYEVIIYVYETSMEKYLEKWKWLSLDGEKPTREIADKFYYYIQRTPALPKLIYKVGTNETQEENNTHYYRYLDSGQRDSDALEHLEKIVNRYEEENGALLYLNHDATPIAIIAESIIKHGRSSVVWEYIQCDDRYAA